MANTGLPSSTMAIRIICVNNQKGGTSKTLTAVNVAHGLARHGRRVLLLDMDSQGSATMALGLRPAPAAYALLMENRQLDELVQQARENLDLLAGDESLADVRDFLGIKSTRNSKKSLRTLADALGDDIEKYDYIITDNGPGLDMLVLNSIMLADEILLPVSMDFLSAAGTNQYLDTLESMQDAGSRAELAYVVPTKYDGRLNRVKAILEILERTFGELVTEPIRNNTALGEAPHYGRSIFEHAPTSNGAVDYEKLVQRIMNDER